MARLGAFTLRTWYSPQASDGSGESLSQIRLGVDGAGNPWRGGQRWIAYNFGWRWRLQDHFQPNMYGHSALLGQAVGVSRTSLVDLGLGSTKLVRS